MSKVYAVIHYLTDELALEQALLAHSCGVDGVFLISHYGKDDLLPELGLVIKKRHPDMQVGLNYLSSPISKCALEALDYKLDMVWGDSCGVDSTGLTQMGLELSNWAMNNKSVRVFASVAFKYQKKEVSPELAALEAMKAGFIATTSGAATGVAPEVAKIKNMSQAVNGQLAVASGINEANVALFKPYLSHILVATGVSIDEHHFDKAKLERFVKLAH